MSREGIFRAGKFGRFRANVSGFILINILNVFECAILTLWLFKVVFLEKMHVELSSTYALHDAFSRRVFAFLLQLCHPLFADVRCNCKFASFIIVLIGRFNGCE